MPHLVSDIVKEVIARQPDIALVGEVDEMDHQLAGAVSRAKADVVICRRSGSELASRLVQLLETYPHVAVLAINDGERTGSAYQLRLTQSPLDVRPEGLVDAIRNVARSQPFSWSTRSDNSGIRSDP
jgi:DNA-binding NarL/FixJ family response regulator